MASWRLASCGSPRGDRVVMRRNDRKLGVVNGERGIVVGVDTERGELEVELRGHRTCGSGREYVANAQWRSGTRSRAMRPRG